MKAYSVLMSLYRNEKPEYLHQAVDSMLCQTVSPDEIVLVEDGPLTAELYAVVDQYCTQYPELFHIVVNEKNLGLGLALNRGLSVCRNDLVARMDTDDISKPDRCEKQLRRFFEKPELAIVGSHVDEFSGTTENVISRRTVPLDSKSIYEYAKRRSAFNHPAVMYRKCVVLACGGYKNMRRNQDVDLFGRILFTGYQTENVNEALLWFRSDEGLARRRKSWENTSSYVGTIYNFWKMGYSSFRDFAVVAAAQASVLLIPIKLQELVYKNFLRN